MSFDDYARHIAQKYRLAISIAILNIKPADMSVDEFLNQIKRTNNNETVDELNISACSDDFILDSDEINLDQNQKASYDNEQSDIDNYMNQSRLSYNSINEHNYVKVVNESQVNTGTKSSVVSESTETDKGIDNTTQVGEDREASNLNSQVTDLNKQRKEKFRELIKVLKGDDVVATDKVKDSQTIEDSNKTSDSMDIDLTQCYDTDSLNLLNNFDKDFEQNCQNQLESQGYEPNNKYCTNISTFEKEIVKNLRKRLNDNACGQESKITKNVHNITENNTNDIIITNETENDVNLYDFSNFQNNNITNIVNNNGKGVLEPNSSENYIDDTKSTNKSSKKNLQGIRHKVQSQLNPVFIDTQETIIYTDTLMNTHYSESQMNDDVSIDKQFIHGNNNIDISYKNVSHIEVNSQNYGKEKQNHTNNENYKNFNEKDAAFKERNIENDKEKINNELAHKNCAVFDKTANTDDTLLTDKDCTVSDETSLDINEGLKEGKEKIPFKIIEEINRIKMYLRRNEKDISSSYRSSSSQNKSAFGGTPTNWIGQSASNIFNYLNNCALIASTQHLNQQISEVLGQLIDRLHEEEIYPAFLEDLLTTVENTLKSLYEEESYIFDVLFKKDELLQRLHFLIKSVHVQKFTINKINKILQKFLEESADTTIETKDINKTENLCYIFEILQILLPKYSVSSKVTQTSPDERVLRKKDITEIWRKKWIDKKIEKNEGSCETKCVLKECSAILNRIIIDFMDGYGLISFSALQCFNLIQS